MAKSRHSKRIASIRTRKESKGRNEQERFRAAQKTDQQRFLVKVARQLR